MMTTRATAAIIACCFTAQGCGAGWRRMPVLEPGPLPSRQQVQVWHGGQVERWHALVISADSVAGVPYMRPIPCDTCRAVLARSQVDSIRLGNPVAGFWKTAALIIGIPLGVFAVVCAIEGGGPPCSPGS